MSRRVWLIALLLSGGMTAPAVGRVKLAWQFQVGETFYAECQTSVSGVVTLQGKESKRDVVNSIVASFKVKEIKGDSFILVEKIELVRERNSAGANSLTFDLFRDRLKGITFTIALQPNGEITNFKGYNAALKKLAGGNEQFLKTLKSLLPRESLKGFAQGVFVPLPLEAVKSGSNWKRPLAVPLGPLGSFESKNRYVFKGKNGVTAKIAVTADMKYAPPKGSGGALAFKITGGGIRSDRAEGTILFDTSTGRLKRSEMRIHFKGSLKLTTGKNSANMEVEQDQTIVIRMLNKNPVDAVKPPRP